MIKTTDPSEQLKIILEYRKRRAFLEKYSSGSKGRLNFYAVDLFLTGKSNSKWIDKLLEQDTINDLKTNSTIRLLSNQTTTIKIEEGEFQWKVFLNELKYWVYVLSWAIKLYSLYLVAKIKKKEIVSEWHIKFLNITKKLHFLFFNLVVVDVAFICTRTILHS